ncbi:MAG: hypothetical protein RLZZ26_528 [Candidatus Parcubacteria bacterium]|jgi:phosphoglycolate phosphatase
MERADTFILFDFDGVIVDSFRAAYESARLLCPHLTEENHRERFEGNIHDRQDRDEAHTAECRRDDAEFYAAYYPKVRNEVQLFPGMKEVVATLAEEHTLVVISSTPTDLIEELLSSYDLLRHFAWVMGADVHKSKVEKIKMVFDKYRIGPSHCVFITDTLGDLREAGQMGVGAIAVGWGFHDVERLMRGSPAHVVHTPDDLVPTVTEYFARNRI